MLQRDSGGVGKDKGPSRLTHLKNNGEKNSKTEGNSGGYYREEIGQGRGGTRKN